MELLSYLDTPELSGGGSTNASSGTSTSTTATNSNSGAGNDDLLALFES